DELGGYGFNSNMSLTLRPGPRWQLTMRPQYMRRTDSQQYVTRLSGGRPETFGSRYVFGYIHRTEYSMELRASFTLKPDLNLDVYAEPFASSGHYYDLGELASPKSIERITYGRDAGTQVAMDADGNRTVTWGPDTFTVT